MMRENENDEDADKTDWSEVFLWKKAMYIGIGLMWIQTMTGSGTM